VLEERIIGWAMQGMRDGVRVWRDGDATAVACPALFRRDRIAVGGSPRPVAGLVERALAEVGPGYRVFGRRELIENLVASGTGLEEVGRFGWMDAPGRLESGPGGATVRWLGPAEYGEVDALLDAAFPASYARPGLPGVRRWAGVHDRSGALVAVAADAWSTSGLGFMSGVATGPAARGRGYGEAVCRFALRALISDYGRAALSVDADNDPAIRVYLRLGMQWADVTVARVVGAPTDARGATAHHQTGVRTMQQPTRG
jgi:GNAT superfamily N-acetyltransferase